MNGSAHLGPIDRRCPPLLVCGLIALGVVLSVTVVPGVFTVDENN